MVQYVARWKADQVDGVEFLFVSKSRHDSISFFLQLECSGCREPFSGYCLVDSGAVQDVPSSRGSCHLAAKCKFCLSVGTVSVSFDSVSRTRRELFLLDCRGVSPLRCSVSDGFSVETAEGLSLVDDVEFDRDGDWSGFLGAAKAPVGIFGLGVSFERI